MRSCERFRKLVKQQGVIQIPGAYDCITATLVEQAGFPAVYLTGSGISLTLTGTARSEHRKLPGVASGRAEHPQRGKYPYACRH